MRQTAGGTTYNAAHQCIYCGGNQHLTREHIVPFGLHGDLILPSASCSACQKTTSAVETFVLKHVFGLIRTKYGFRSQNNNNRRRPDGAAAFQIEADGSKTAIPLLKEQLPFLSWSLPIYDMPALLSQIPYDQVVRDDKIHCIVSKVDAETILDAGGGNRPVEFQLMPYDIQKFSRFLAKIAHGFACATIGRANFPHILGPFIQQGHEKPRVFVGGLTEIEEPRPAIYSLALGKITDWRGDTRIGVRIRLLSFMGTPTYVVAVSGTVDDDFPLPPHGSYEKLAKVSVRDPRGTTIFSTAPQKNSSISR